MDIYISGSLAYDRIMEFPEPFSAHILPDKLNDINVCFMVNGMKENFGGTAGNIAYAFKLLGGAPLITASLGMDHQRYTTWLTQNGITTDLLRLIDDEWTAGAYITTDSNNNQITNFNPGAMKYSSSFDFDTIADTSLMIVSPGNLDDMVMYPRKCQERGIAYIFDPGQAMPMLQPDDLLNCIDGCMLLMVNDYEMSLILGKTEKSHDEIVSRAGNIIITRGGAGSTLYTGGDSIKIPVIKADTVADPTGAGDAYRGGLLSGLIAEKSLEECCLLGSTCASFAVQSHGTQEYSFSPDQFATRLKSV